MFTSDLPWIFHGAPHLGAVHDSVENPWQNQVKSAYEMSDEKSSKAPLLSGE